MKLQVPEYVIEYLMLASGDTREKVLLGLVDIARQVKERHQEKYEDKPAYEAQSITCHMMYGGVKRKLITTVNCYPVHIRVGGFGAAPSESDGFYVTSFKINSTISEFDFNELQNELTEHFLLGKT